MIKWSDRLAIGIEMVDSHHQRVVELISAFVETLRSEGAERSLVEVTLTALVEDSRVHFAEEEALMAFCGLDDLHRVAHTHEHRTFIDDIRMLATQVDMASSQRINEISEQLVRFITAWLMLHIVSMDQAMASQICAIDAGSSSADAYRGLQSDRHAARSSRAVLLCVLDLWRDAFDQCRRLEARLSALTPHSAPGVHVARWPLIDHPDLTPAHPTAAQVAAALRATRPNLRVVTG